jgi:hypothetical protein
LLQNRVKANLDQAAGPKKLKTENPDEVTILNVPLPVVWPLEQEVNVVDVGCGSRHTIVLLGKSLLEVMVLLSREETGAYKSHILFH